MHPNADASASWRDIALADDMRVDALLAVMTLREKVQQLGSSWPGADTTSGDVAPMQDTQLRAEPFHDAIRDGLGQITRAFGTAPVNAADGRSRLVEMQQQVVAANRFGIPAIAHEECLTGFTAWTATVYPTPLAWAATNDPALIHDMGRAIGRDMRSLGIHQGLAPVLDVVRDPRWGRVEETLGEDPALVGELGSAYVRGLQAGGVIATLKHFVGYSASKGGRNHAPVSIGPRELADVLLPPFARAVLEGEVGSVMNSYSDIDGVPPAADPHLLTEILRDTWGFAGTVVSDYWAVPFLQSTHGIVGSVAAAGVAALRAGIDVELPHTLAFGDHLLDAVERGELDETHIDRAARRVLLHKVRQGLLNPDWAPDRDGTDDVDLDSAANRDLARRIAEESVIVLENRRGLLPRANIPQHVAVLGPGADDPGCLFGCYSFPNHVVVNHPGTPIGIDAPTVLDALRFEYPDATISHVPGVTVTGRDMSGIPAAAAAAAAADLTVLVVGDHSGMFGHGTSGEGCDVTELSLPGAQEDLVRSVLDASDNVVLVVLSGRPYAIGQHAERAAAAVQVFFPGEAGAAALAGVLSGRVPPSGRLPVQIPNEAAPQPSSYLAAPLAFRSDGISNLDPTPAYPFGYGLSYSSLTIEDLHVDHDTVPVDGVITVSALLGNSGARAAWHVPQLYVTSPPGGVTRPRRRRLASKRVYLEAGEHCTVRFTVHTDLLAASDRDLIRRVPIGACQFVIAFHAADTRPECIVTITGHPRPTDRSQMWDVPVSVDPL